MLPTTSAVLRGGPNVYGLPVGILMLETCFPRPRGDLGNALTFPFPVLYRVVKRASPEWVVERSAAGLLDDFVEGARWLERQGVRAITTSCGFLVLYQRELAASVRVPVVTSSLLQAPLVQALIGPERRVGVLTVSARGLTPAHLAAAGIDPERVPIRGLEHTRAFYPAIIGNRPELDQAAARAEVVEAARAFAAETPDLGAFVFECTNLCPYSADVEAATGLPVFDILSLVHWLHGALYPRPFPPGL